MSAKVEDDRGTEAPVQSEEELGAAELRQRADDRWRHFCADVERVRERQKIPKTDASWISDTLTDYIRQQAAEDFHRDAGQQLDEKGFAVRHQLGLKLNDKLGPPNKRNAQAPRLIKALKSWLSESDVSRLCNFAYRVPDLEAFLKKNPKVRTWSQAKAWVDEQAKIEKGEEGKSGDEKVCLLNLKKAQEALKVLCEKEEEAGKAMRKLAVDDADELDDLIEKFTQIVAERHTRKKAPKANA